MKISEILAALQQLISGRCGLKITLQLWGQIHYQGCIAQLSQMIILYHSKQLISCVYGGLKSLTICVSALFLVFTLILF